MSFPIRQILFAAYCSSITAVVIIACGTRAPMTLPPLSPKVADCQYHVIERFLDGNEELVARVMAMPRGEPQVEELVQALLDVGKSSDAIVAAGEELWACMPKKVVAPIPDAGNKVMRLEAVSSEMLASSEPGDCEGQGCCSHHGGECGCFGRAVQCCDGSTSPSCKCW